MTSTTQELLIVAVQDLLEAERMWLERLPELGRNAPKALGSFMAEERMRASVQASRLGAILEGFSAGTGMPNIWLTAILDDAKRDSETIEQGPLRAIAMTGAFRKGKQAERVSYETAVGLAQSLGLAEAATKLTASRDEEAAGDVALADLLAELLQEIS